MDVTDNTINGYCIYHYLNKYETDYRGYIEDTIEVHYNDEKYHECDKESEFLTKRWDVVGTFYALNPMFRPIPYNMISYTVKYTDYEPRKIIDFRINYDLTTFEENTVNFTAYNQQLPNTIPIYLWVYAGNIVPTFNDKPPTEDKGWEKHIIPVFYALEQKDNKFTCYEGNIIYSPKSNKTLYENLMICDKTETLFDMIKSMKKKNTQQFIKFTNDTSVNNISTIILSILSLIVIVVFSYLFYLKYNNKLIVP